VRYSFSNAPDGKDGLEWIRAACGVAVINNGFQQLLRSYLRESAAGSPLVIHSYVARAALRTDTYEHPVDAATSIDPVEADDP
jgi:hypothetical protein